MISRVPSAMGRSSLTAGIVAPSVMLRKLAAYRRQNQPDLALQQLGRIERALFMLDWLVSRNCADAIAHLRPTEQSVPDA